MVEGEAWSRAQRWRRRAAVPAHMAAMAAVTVAAAAAAVAVAVAVAETAG